MRCVCVGGGERGLESLIKATKLIWYHLFYCLFNNISEARAEFEVTKYSQREAQSSRNAELVHMSSQRESNDC